MVRTGEITLGGTVYVVHAFNIGELERVTDVFQGPPHRVSFTVLRIALERAEPKVDPTTIEATTDEVAAAMMVILELAGLKTAGKAGPPGADPPKAPPAA